MVKSVARLGQRWQPLDTLLTVVEGRCASDDEKQSWEASGVDLVEELSQRVESLFPYVATDPLECLGLVEYKQQPGVPAVAQHGEQSLEELERGEMVEVSAHPGRPTSGRGHRLLSADPGDKGFGRGTVARRNGLPVAAQSRREGGGGSCHVGEPSLHQFVDGLCQCLGVVLFHVSRIEDLVLQSVEPRVDDRSQRAGLVGGGGEAFGEPSVDGLEPVEGRLGL